MESMPSMPLHVSNKASDGSKLCYITRGLGAGICWHSERKSAECQQQDRHMVACDRQSACGIPLCRSSGTI